MQGRGRVAARRLGTVAIGSVLCLSLAAPSGQPALAVTSANAEAAVKSVVAEPDPRVSLVVATSSVYSTTFEAASTDGAHVLISTVASLSGATSSYLKLYDAIADRFLPWGGHVFYEAMTPDAAFVMFTTSEALVPEDMDSQLDIYISDGHDVRLVSVGTAMSQMTAFSLADDGSTATFSTKENLSSADGDLVEDVYQWHAATGTLTLVSPGTPVPAYFAAMSPDGSRVFVQVDEDFVGVGSISSLFEYSSGTLIRIGDGALDSVSADSERVYFTGKRPYVPGDLDGTWDAYEVSAAGYRLLSAPTVGWTDFEAVNADGSRWLISASEKLDATDTDVDFDLYEYASGNPQLVSNGVGPSYFELATPTLDQVAFRTASAIQATDVDESVDLYLWSASNPGTSQLITSGVLSGASDVDAIDPSGSVVVFDTTEGIDAEDPDSAVDVYRWTTNRRTILSPDSIHAVSFAGASRDVQRVFFQSIDTLDPGDTNNTSDVYVSDMDVTPPVATIAGPLTPTGVEATLFVGTEDDDAVWFDCQLDGGPWTPCGSSVTFDTLTTGEHVAAVHAYDAASNRSTQPAAWTWFADTGVPNPDATPPSGSVSIDAGAPYAVASQVSLSVPATDLSSSIAEVSISNDRLSWSTRVYSPSQTWTLVAGTGMRTVYAKWKDSAGNWSSEAMDAIYLDEAAPAVSATVAAIQLGNAANGQIPIGLTWSGADIGSGVVGYQLDQQIDGGVWVRVGNPAATSVTRSVEPAHSYRFRLRALDTAGNTGAWRTVGPWDASMVADGKLTYMGAWSTLQSTSLTDGVARQTTQVGAAASFSFTGASIAWLATKSTGGGSAKVFVDGALVATVSLYQSTSAARQIVFSRSWARAGTHTLRVVNIGPVGRPMINLDGLVTLAGAPTGVVTIQRTS